MKTKIEMMQKELTERMLMPLFEIPAINMEDGSENWILFDVSISRNSIFAQHIALSSKEEKSKKIAYKSIPIDTDFCLDHHLEQLYELCIDGIIEGDLYRLQ